MSFALQELDGGFGREVVGLDITGGIAAETSTALRNAGALLRMVRKVETGGQTG